MARLLNCKSDTFPISYLGIPLRLGKLHHEDWQPMLIKIDEGLAGWKGIVLSRGGSLSLVNSVITAVPLYMMSFYKVSAWVRDQIDRMGRNFFWKGGRERIFSLFD